MEKYDSYGLVTDAKLRGKVQEDINSELVWSLTTRYSLVSYTKNSFLGGRCLHSLQ